MPFPALLPIWGTSNAKCGLKHDSLELFIDMISYHPMDVHYLHCIKDRIHTIEAIRNSVLESFRVGLGGNEYIGLGSAKLIGIPIVSFLPTKKTTVSR